MSEELDRIRAAFSAYEGDSSTQRRWDPSNPGNVAMRGERVRVARSMLDEYGCWPLSRFSTLEVGCGRGQVMSDFHAAGAPLDSIVGIDLIEERVNSAGIPLLVGDGARLPVGDGCFSVVLAFTLFSSILDPTLRARVASEIDRVLRPRGVVLVYDFRYGNPMNKHTIRINAGTVRELFSGYEYAFRTLSLIPPVARRLGRSTSPLYSVLASVPFLRTHTMGALRKPV